ncbi:two-component response regulator ARR14-like [Arachis ipaensis]|uniref:two-component response regulator ARR14-like n=1 Tax=Arachis ipaensis TaxID=130454 RepID=UPI0007AF3C59|nr:two-component response regulator ARR14-like [Arachis ipaensis]XP_025640897.1 two-component response regulator ARR14-like [Arachis hypogaea]
MAANNNPHSLADQNANSMPPPILDHQFSTTTAPRLLVVDHDPEHLRLIQDMAFQCNYQVTTCFEGSHALNLLRESSGCFDVVLCDVHMPGIMDDGSRLLDHVLQEFNIPVVMMCATDDESSIAVMEGMKKKGACYNLVKPLSEQDLMNIWQNVMEKTQKEVFYDDDDESKGTVNRRKRSLSTERDDHDVQSNTPNKKPRFIWTQERHQMFVDAVLQLGIDKAVPRKILELMDIPNLTRENVASHLQKYRMHLKKKSQETKQTNSNGKINVNREANKQLCAPLRVQASTNIPQITQTLPVHHQYYSSLLSVPKQDPIIMSSKCDHHFHHQSQPIVSTAPHALMKFCNSNSNPFGLINKNDIVGSNMALNHQNNNDYGCYIIQQSNYNYGMMASQPCDGAAFQGGMRGGSGSCRNDSLVDYNAFSSSSSSASLALYHHQMNNSVSGSGSIAEILNDGYIPTSSVDNTKIK